MTTPVIPASVLGDEQPGVGDRIGSAIAPFMAMLKERYEREQRQNQLMLQRGKLAIEEEDATARRKTESDDRKGREEVAAGLSAEIAKLKEPGPITREIAGALQSGDSGLMAAVSAKAGRAAGLERQAAVRQKYTQKSQQGALTDDDKLAFYHELLQADPESEHAGSLSTVINTLEAQRGRTLNAPTQITTVTRNGVPTQVLINKRTGAEIAEVGEARGTYVDFLKQYGSSPQSGRAQAGVRYHNAYQKIKELARDADVLGETAAAITVIEGLATLPLNLGQLAEYTSRAATQGQLSPGAQVMLNNVYDLLAAEGFGEGGKQLTAKEWAVAVRGLAPLSGESPASTADKLKRMDQRWQTLRSLSGPAWKLVTGQLRGGDTGVAEEETPKTLDEKLRKTRGLGR